MKWNPIGSLVARYFGKPATSASPHTALYDRESSVRIPPGTVITREMLDEFWEQFRPGGRFHVPGVSPEPAPSRPEASSKPAPSNSDFATWASWKAQMTAEQYPPGWAFCRFANRIGSESCGFVFGLVRGNFGLWRSPFQVCHIDPDADEATQSEDILTSITHLRTGTGLGIFAEHAVARQAAELADRLGGWDCDDVDYPQIRRTLDAWAAVGVRPAFNAHAHDLHGNRFNVYGASIESISEGKPEKLS